MELQLNGTTRDGGLAFFEDARRRIAAIPGVDAVAFAAKLPVGGRSSFGLVHRAGEDESATTGTDASLNRVTPDYFRSMRIPLRRGRDFTATDAADAPKVAIVNDEMARRLWGSATRSASGSSWARGSIAPNSRWLASRGTRGS